MDKVINVAKELWDKYVTVIPMAKGNRMLRIGIGQHDGRVFTRVDLWFRGYRIASK